MRKVPPPFSFLFSFRSTERTVQSSKCPLLNSHRILCSENRPHASFLRPVEISRPQVPEAPILIFFRLLRPPYLHLPVVLRSPGCWLSHALPETLLVSGPPWVEGLSPSPSANHSHAGECGECDSRRNEKKIIFNFKENPRYLYTVNIRIPHNL